MRVALYARVSTSDQTVAPQLDGLREYARSRQLDIVGEFVDEGVSGAKTSRPALDDLLAKARVRLFDAVAIVRLDRMARSTRHLTQIAAELEALGVDLIVTEQQIDTSTPAGRFLFNTLAAVAELERDLIQERVVAGIRAARSRGIRFGRPRRLGDEDLARIQRLRASGHTVRAIAEQVGVSKSLVANVLSTTPYRQRPNRPRKPAGLLSALTPFSLSINLQVSGQLSFPHTK